MTIGTLLLVAHWLETSGPDSIPGMSLSETAITRGIPIMLKPPTTFRVIHAHYYKHPCVEVKFNLFWYKKIIWVFGTRQVSFQQMFSRKPPPHIEGIISIVFFLIFSCFRIFFRRYYTFKNYVLKVCRHVCFSDQHKYLNMKIRESGNITANRISRWILIRDWNDDIWSIKAPNWFQFQFISCISFSHPDLIPPPVNKLVSC